MALDLSNCNLCPRACGVDRSTGARGFCTQSGMVTLARAALHMWEEPPITGARGSGTVFFSGCSLRCVYCQNREISGGLVIKEVSIERLAQIFLEQQGRGAHNINLVTPTHFAPQIIEALDIAKEKGLALPIVYNTSGYETAEAVDSLKGYVDIFLTDFKYASTNLAQRYSAAPDYPQIASRALDAMYELVGPVRINAQSGLLEKGIVVRHLLLPGALSDSFAVLRHLAAKPYAHEILLSLMSQYTPLSGIEKQFPELATTVDEDDYEALVNYSLHLGFEDAFCQEGSAASESFIPSFTYEGV